MRNWPSKFKSDQSPEGASEDEMKVFTVAQSEQQAPSAGNKIYFYSEVNKESVLGLNRQIDELTKQLKLVQFTFNMKAPPPIELHISSEGGDMLFSLSAVDKILTNPVPVDTYVEGIAASAATLISVSGAKRYMSKNSCMLIHQVSSAVWGSYVQFQDEMKNLELLMDKLKDIYVDRTKLTSEILEDILKHDILFDSEDCLKHGLVDKIL